MTRITHRQIQKISFFYRMTERQQGVSDLSEKREGPTSLLIHSGKNPTDKNNIITSLDFVFFLISWFPRPLKASQLWDCDSQPENDFLNGWRHACPKRGNKMNWVSDDHLHVCGHRWCNVRSDDSSSALCKQYSTTEPSCWHGSRNLLPLTDDNPLAMQSSFSPPLLPHPQSLFLQNKLPGRRNLMEKIFKKKPIYTFLILVFLQHAHRENTLWLETLFLMLQLLSAFLTRRCDNSPSRSRSSKKVQINFCSSLRQTSQTRFPVAWQIDVCLGLLYSIRRVRTCFGRYICISKNLSHATCELLCL